MKTRVMHILIKLVYRLLKAHNEEQRMAQIRIKKIEDVMTRIDANFFYVSR
jgi:hypothetical protein